MYYLPVHIHMTQELVKIKKEKEKKDMWFLKKKCIRQNAGEKWKEKQGKGITDKREER